MWARIFRLLSQEANAGNNVSEKSLVAFALELLEALCAIQSEPSEVMPEAERTIVRFMADIARFEDLAMRVREGGPLSNFDVLAMTYLADAMFQLESKWDGYYVPAFSMYPTVGTMAASVRQFLREFPFLDGISVLAEQWRANDRAIQNETAGVYLTTCALCGIYAETPLYARVAQCLAFGGPFLATVVTAYCVKTLVAQNLVDVRDLTTDQYECMALLDNFYTGPDGAWG